MKDTRVAKSQVGLQSQISKISGDAFDRLRVSAFIKMKPKCEAEVYEGYRVAPILVSIVHADGSVTGISHALHPPQTMM